MGSEMCIRDRITESTPAEIEALFELSQPISHVRAPPPRTKRAAPQGLERQIIRLLVAHPVLAAEMDQTAIDAAVRLAPDGEEMLMQLVTLGRDMGSQANFAILAEMLRSSGSDLEPLIAEIAAEPESDVALARLELAGAIRQIKMQALREELAQLVAGGLAGEEAQARFRELTLQQEQLRRQAQAEMMQRG